MYPIKSVQIRKALFRRQRPTNTLHMVPSPNTVSATVPKDVDQGIHELHCSLCLMMAR